MRSGNTKPLMEVAKNTSSTGYRWSRNILYVVCSRVIAIRMEVDGAMRVHQESPLYY